MKKLKKLFYFGVFVFVFVIVPYKYLVPKYEYFVSDSEYMCSRNYYGRPNGYDHRISAGQIIRFNKYTGEFRIVEPEYRDYKQVVTWGK